MTIGIGVLATEIKQPDRIILLSDTQGSVGSAQSTNRLHKQFAAPESNLYGTCADLPTYAGELFALIAKQLGPKLQAHGSIVERVTDAMDKYKRFRFRMEVLPRYAYRVDSLASDFTGKDLTPELLQEWQKFYVGCAMIIGTFDSENRAVLFSLDGLGAVETVLMPGHTTIGAGSDQATFWMNYRDLHFGMSPRKAAYCAFEAKVMAQNSPDVNDRLDLMIAGPEGFSYSSDDQTRFESPRSVESPITLEELRDLFQQYGPRSIPDNLSK